MIACQDENIFGARGLNLEELLADSVGGALLPAFSAESLFGGPNLHPAAVERVEIICAGDMPVQRNRIELGQHGDMVDTGIDAIAYGDIDQAVFSSDWDCRFGTVARQRVKTGAAPAAHDDAENIVECLHAEPSLSCGGIFDLSILYIESVPNF